MKAAVEAHVEHLLERFAQWRSPVSTTITRVNHQDDASTQSPQCARMAPKPRLSRCNPDHDRDPEDRRGDETSR
jgi:hypothetical protein